MAQVIEKNGYILTISGCRFNTGETYEISAFVPVGTRTGDGQIDITSPTGHVDFVQKIAQGETFKQSFVVKSTNRGGYWLTLGAPGMIGVGTLTFWLNADPPAWFVCPDTPIPTPTPTPTPTPSPGPEIIECVFPALQWNLIQILSDLVAWIGCILHNIITILKWFVTWLLHFPDHLDAWISRLFGVDPSLPFFDEVLKKIDIWISGKFGVDPSLPFWEELVKKALTWIGGVLDAAAEERMRIRGWK